jgi:nucleoside-diphosphate-sugar epimerase
MQMLVTGAAGFLGARLVRALLASRGDVERIVAADVVACAVDDPRVDARVGSIADPGFVRTLVDPHVRLVFHLAAVLSGQSEAEFDTGLRINVDATRALLEACRAVGTAPRVVFSSSIAVFGGPLPDVVPDDMALRPQSSYGTAKAIAELLVADYGRRGFVDGVACRLPTVAVRPGAPNSALSSFVSGIIREPVAGIDTVCPVPLGTRIWISSPDVVTRNLLHAGAMDTATLDVRRSVNLPGISVTAGEMLDSLERVAGQAARLRVRCQPDERLMRIVGTWPAAFDVSRARQLGFVQDSGIDAIVQQYVAEWRGAPAS